MAGITSTGFEAKPLDDIKSEMESDQRGLISTKVNTSSASMLGQVNGIMATKLRELWEGLQAVHDAFFADGATDVALTLRAALTGTTREAATYSRVTAQVNLDAGTYLAGTLVASVLDSPDSRFTNLEDITSAGGSNDAVFEALVTGPVRANSGTLTVIAQAVTGWNSITNAEDATLGELEERDPVLRARREAELRIAGSTNVEAIRTDLEALDGVENVRILENDTPYTDANGVPRNSIECVVYGPASPTADDDAVVAETIWRSKGGGIGTYGSTSVTVVDDNGEPHVVRFTRAEELHVYVWVTVDTNADTYAGETAVKEAIADAVTGYSSGQVLRWTRHVSSADSVEGVIDTVSVGQNTTGTPSGSQDDITPTIRQVVRVSTGDVTVTS